MMPPSISLECLKGPFAHPFELFPPEIWEIIFQKLENSKDLQNVINATPEWRALLEKDRKLFLFPQVFDILVKRENIEFMNYFTDDSPSTAMNCRLVCKSWNTAIENHVQLHPKHFYLESLENRENIGNDEEHEEQLWQHYLFEWYCQYGIQSFLQDFEDTHSSEHNPFLTRWVVLSDAEQVGPPCCWQGPPQPELEFSRQFWNSITRLLEKYGSHIYHFELTLGYNLTPSTYYCFLQQWLSHLPNVKVLKVNFNKFVYDKDIERRIHRHRRAGTGGRTASLDEPISNNSARSNRFLQRENIQVEEEIALSPLPKLEHLEFLETFELPNPIFHHLLQKNSHVKKLKVEAGHGSPINYSDYFKHLSAANNLQEMFINLRNRRDLLDLETSLISASTTWSVKTLHIHYETIQASHAEPFIDEDWPEWERVFRLLEEKFGTSLTTLHLRLPKAGKVKDTKAVLNGSPNFNLALPHLKKLRVELPNLTTVDFLLGMKDTLEELILVVAYWECMNSADQRKEKIKFNGKFDQMKKSNIWKELPKLKRLTVKILTENQLCLPPPCTTHSYVRE